MCFCFFAFYFFIYSNWANVAVTINLNLEEGELKCAGGDSVLLFWKSREFHLADVLSCVLRERERVRRRD